MKSFKTSTRFRKDLKRYKNKPSKIKAMKDFLELLKNEQPIPKEYNPHMLIGNYNGCMECHIQGDFLLIWIDEVNDVIELLRLGSHAELFG